MTLDTLRRRRLAAAVLCGVACAALPLAPSPARESIIPIQRTVTVPVHAPYHDLAIGEDGFACRGLAQPADVVDPADLYATAHNVVSTCVAVETGRSIFTGSIDGVATYTGYSYLDVDGRIPYEGPDDFINTTVAGCGVGTFTLWTYHGIIDTTPEGFHPDPVHPEDSYFDGSNDWRVEPGSTTSRGEPFLVSGTGHNEWKYYPFHEGTEESPGGVGTYTGDITCVRR
jgi:hypothetical protein